MSLTETIPWPRHTPNGVTRLQAAREATAPGQPRQVSHSGPLSAEL